MSDYNRWSTTQDVILYLMLAQADGTGLTGGTPTVQIRRAKSVNGDFLDNYYWNGADFTATPTSATMVEVDSINEPGLYEYVFSQSLIQSESIYRAYFEHDLVPVGFDHESHLFTVTLSGSVEGDIKLYESEPER